ncbi:hypothetical protein F2Q69_00035516 [Brassica cretica]|uniref:Uncharacterized protein n=1 Tax=Brassica cretica TaxID=69181 RepID=A0A8S9SSJ0_BRACR|nr:hypothetical protein F2Q69_00035516 [Brassica cretica]
MCENYIASFSESFPIPLSCHLLNLLLSAAFQSNQAARKVENFAASMLCDLCNTTERLLSQSVEHRSCAVSFLPPAIFKAFSSQSSLKISLQGNVYVLSSYKFQEWLQKMNMGMLQEAVLGWINRGLSSGSWTDGTESYVSEKDPVEFDFRSEHEFWEEIKKGLIWQKYLLFLQILSLSTI